MVERIRYYADQHYPAIVTAGLARRGIDTATAQTEGNCGAIDPDQLRFATDHHRVLLAFDSDFLALHRSGQSHAGIVWCPATKYGVGELIKLLVLLHGVASSADMENHVEYL